MKRVLRRAVFPVLLADLYLSAAVSLRSGAASQSFEGSTETSGSRTFSSAFTHVEQNIAANEANQAGKFMSEGHLRRVDASIRSLIWALGEIFFPSSRPAPRPQQQPGAPTAPQAPGPTAAPEEPTGFPSNPWLWQLVYQLFFGLIYYFMIVSKYPKIDPDVKPPDAAKDIQKQNPLMAILNASCANNCLSYCCPGPRFAHTLHATGSGGYWPSLCAMVCFPQCTVCAAHSFTKLNPRLGGAKRSMLMSCLCSCCCMCCVIAQDAEALDASTGTRTGLCGVSKA